MSSEKETAVLRFEYGGKFDALEFDGMNFDSSRFWHRGTALWKQHDAQGNDDECKDESGMFDFHGVFRLIVFFTTPTQ